MPFAYYGAKHKMARYYSPPEFGTIVEPFAGSAAYSVRHARNVDRVILIEKDPAVVDLWNRIMTTGAESLDDVDRILRDETRTTDPLLGALAGGSTLRTTLAGTSVAITPWMREHWPWVRARIARTMPYLHRFEICNGSYESSQNIEATWFIDPPYKTDSNAAHVAGNAYRESQSNIDYRHLAEWSQERLGHVIVCEQMPADWLPFRPFRGQNNAVNTRKTEVVWEKSHYRHELVVNA